MLQFMQFLPKAVTIKWGETISSSEEEDEEKEEECLQSYRLLRNYIIVRNCNDHRHSNRPRTAQLLPPRTEKYPRIVTLSSLVRSHEVKKESKQQQQQQQQQKKRVSIFQKKSSTTSRYDSKTYVVFSEFGNFKFVLTSTRKYFNINSSCVLFAMKPYSTPTLEHRSLQTSNFTRRAYI